MKYRFLDCEINIGPRTVLCRGSSVHVEPQVFDLIVHLIENRTRILDKDELIPSCADQHSCAHLRIPMDLMRAGWAISLFQASQQ